MTLRLQLHVGHGKTGSSYLQSWLAANAAVLLNQHHLLYPQVCPLTRVRDRRAEQSQFSMGNGFVLNPVLEAGVLKAFVAGLVVGNLNKGLVLGFLLGSLGGLYIQQNFSKIPDVRGAWLDLKARWRR